MGEQTLEQQTDVEASKSERSSEGVEPPGHRPRKTLDNSRTRKQAWRRIAQGTTVKGRGQVESNQSVSPVAE